MERLRNRLRNRLTAAAAFGLQSADVQPDQIDECVGTQNEASRIAWLTENLAQLPAGARILDAGAGELRFKDLCGHLNYVSQDFGQYDGKGDDVGMHTGSWNQEKLDIVSDITAIPEPEGSFDAIMCIEVLEHLPSPILAIKEFSRLLKTGGHLIMTAPFCSLTHLAPYHFYTGFNRYFYETHLPAHGFQIVELQPNGNFFEYLAQELRRLPQIAEQYAQDQPQAKEVLALDTVINMLGRLSDKDQGSADMLHFGFHVSARRI